MGGLISGGRFIIRIMRGPPLLGTDLQQGEEDQKDWEEVGSWLPTGGAKTGAVGVFRC